MPASPSPYGAPNRPSVTPPIHAADPPGQPHRNTEEPQPEDGRKGNSLSTLAIRRGAALPSHTPLAGVTAPTGGRCPKSLSTVAARPLPSIASPTHTFDRYANSCAREEAKQKAGPQQPADRDRQGRRGAAELAPEAREGKASAHGSHRESTEAAEPHSSSNSRDSKQERPSPGRRPPANVGGGIAPLRKASGSLRLAEAGGSPWLTLGRRNRKEEQGTLQ